MRFNSLCLVIMCAIWPVAVHAAPGETLFEEASHQATFKAVVVAEGLSYLKGLDFLPNGSMITTEWDGSIRITRGDVMSEPISGAPTVSAGGEGLIGMLDIAIHPQFSDNRMIYFCYLHGTDESNVSRIGRARLEDDQLHDFNVIFEGNDRARETHHSGCRLQWDAENHLFATFGDRRHLPDEAQNLGSTTGTIIRIHDDGSIPQDNPFIDNANARPEIWAYGVRNVQGAAWRPDTGDLWFSEHGPFGGDEVNILRRGANYGWPIATYGIDYDGTIITEDVQLPGVDGPLIYWRPSTAPSGLAFYTGNDFPDWQGDLFMGSLADRRLIRMELDGDRILFQEPLLAELDERIRMVRLGPDERLYILTSGDPGRVIRIEPTGR